MEQYVPGITKVYSYLEARKPAKTVVNFGLQYYLKRYFTSKITNENVEEFLDIYSGILGPPSKNVVTKIKSLQKLGYLPLKIKAVPEGSIIPSQNILLSITNTHPDFYWVVGFFESLLLKVWYPYTIASFSRELKDTCKMYASFTGANPSGVEYQVHDFGYRGVTSEEQAEIGGAAHLLNFSGTDTIPSIAFLRKYYNATNPGASVPASEHSVMCSFGREGEYEAFEHMLDTYPNGIVSIVSDTYNLWKVFTDYVPKLKSKIMERNGKVVFRPDSGDQEKILLGDPHATDPAEKKGVFQLLFDEFGYRLNNRGYKLLHPNVGVIYGEGFTKERLQTVFAAMKRAGIASTNLVVGIGGLLLQNHHRDELGFALKATYIEKGNERVNIYKDPITDPGKKSKCGLMRLIKRPGGHGYYYKTEDQQSWKAEMAGELTTVFQNGIILKEYSFDEIRKKLND